MPSALEHAIGLIAKRGALRTPALAEALGIGEAALDAMLEPASRDGRLTTCTVEAGGRRVIEYRCSASGGRYDPIWRKGLHQERRAKGELLFKREETFGTEPPAIEHTPIRAEPAGTFTPKGDPAVTTLIERAQALFKKHGPMTKREIAALDAAIADKIAELCAGAHLGRLGGKTAGVIYGLPDQQLADRRSGEPASAPKQTADRAPRHLHRKKAPKKAAKAPRKRRVKRLGSALARAAARKAWKTRRAVVVVSPEAPPAGAFRPAIAFDGALLLTGAATPGELNRAEARLLAEFIVRMHKGGVEA